MAGRSDLRHAGHRLGWCARLAAAIVACFVLAAALESEAQPRADLPVTPQPLARAHLTSKPEPRYPLLAGASGVRGPVLFEIEVSAEGRVAAARVLHGTPLLEQAATEAVLSWQLAPLVIDGRALAYRTSMVVTFDDPSIDRDTLDGLIVFGDAVMLCLEASRTRAFSRAERRCHAAGNVADRLTKVDRLLPTRARRLQAEALLEMDRPSSALRLLESIDARLRQQPFFSLDRTLGLVALARAYIRLDRADAALRAYAQAERQLTEAWNGAPRNSPFRSEIASYVQAMTSGYVQLLEVVGRAAEADRVRTRLGALR